MELLHVYVYKTDKYNNDSSNNNDNNNADYNRNQTSKIQNYVVNFGKYHVCYTMRHHNSGNIIMNQ